MRSSRGLAATAVLLAAMAAAPAARAQEGNLLSRISYTAEGGFMSGAGPQGRDLGRGPFGGFVVHGESRIGMELGLQASYASSHDALRTKFVGLGAVARLSPTPDDYRAFIELGGALYRVSYSTPAGYAPRSAEFRPGGSFGVGLDVVETTRFSAGAIVSYNGVIIGSSTARAYVIAALTLTLKPSPF